MKAFIKSKLVLSLIFMILLAGAVAIPMAGKITHSHAQGTVTITEFPTETGNSSPVGITSGPDGNLWFTEADASKIGSITPSGTITEYSIPTSGSAPDDITSGPDGNLWFTENAASANKIGKITPSGTITEYSIPTSNSSPVGITSGPDGNLWFTETDANKIGRITPSGTITEYSIPTSNSWPEGITSGPDGNLWFTEQNPSANKIGRITPSGAITEYSSLPTSNSYPDGITSGPDGNLWFTELNGNKIGEITPSGAIAEYSIPTSNSGPRGITSGPDGNLWFTEGGGNKIGEITPSGTITEYAIPTSAFDITSGPDGNLWFTENAASQIGRVNLPSSCSTDSVSSDAQSEGNPSATSCKTTQCGVYATLDKGQTVVGTVSITTSDPGENGEGEGAVQVSDNEGNSFSFTGFAINHPFQITATADGDAVGVCYSDDGDETIHVQVKITSSPTLSLPQKNSLSTKALASSIVGTLLGGVAISAACRLIVRFPGVCALMGQVLSHEFAMVSNNTNKLVTDPDDPSCAIDTPAKLSLPRYSTTQGLSQSEVVTANALIKSMSREIALENALYTTLNRYQGAISSGNKGCASLQLFTARLYAGILAHLLNKEPQVLSAFAKALTASGFPTVTIQPADISSFETNIATNGLSSQDISILQQLGATSDDISEVQELFIVQDPNVIAGLGGGQFPKALSDPAITQASIQAAHALEQFSQQN